MLAPRAMGDIWIISSGMRDFEKTWILLIILESHRPELERGTLHYKDFNNDLPPTHGISGYLSPVGENTLNSDVKNKVSVLAESELFSMCHTL